MFKLDLGKKRRVLVPEGKTPSNNFQNDILKLKVISSDELYLAYRGFMSLYFLIWYLAQIGEKLKSGMKQN